MRVRASAVAEARTRMRGSDWQSRLVRLIGGIAQAAPDRQAPADQSLYGCQITALSKGGNAAQEGLVVGDIILSVNNTPTPDFDS